MDFVVVQFTQGEQRVAVVHGSFQSRDAATRFASGSLANCEWLVTELVPTSVRWSAEEGRYVEM